jgi:hypothetical protein
MTIKNLFSKKTSASARNWGEKKIEDFPFELIEHYYRKKDNSAAFQTISDQLMDDIDFYDLFAYIDRTSSKIGQQYLFNRLLVINTHLCFEEQETLVDYFTHNEEKINRAHTLFSRLNKRESYYISYLFLDKYIPKPKWFWVVPLLSTACLLTLIISFIVHKAIILFFFCYIVNMIIHFWNKRNMLVYMDSIPQFPLLCQITGELMKWKIFSQSDPAINKAIESINKLKKNSLFFKLENRIQSDLEAIITFVWEVLKIMFLLEPLIAFDLFKKLDEKRADIQTLFEYIGKIDCALSITALRKEISFCKPVISDTVHSIEFTDIYHPLIPDCISNSLQTNGKSILLTGSNMSGKTTFIRTVIINALLAQTIHTCFAKNFRMAQTRLFSAIRITDDLFQATSYYFEEVLIIKAFLDESHSTSNNIFFLDEIFKGTNTIERIAAGKSVLSYLVRSNHNLVFVSTHDIELTDLLSEEYDLYHFTETIQERHIHFDYKLKHGNLTTTNAIRILEINNYPKEVINEAKSLC